MDLCELCDPRYSAQYAAYGDSEESEGGPEDLLEGIVKEAGVTPHAVGKGGSNLCGLSDSGSLSLPQSVLPQHHMGLVPIQHVSCFIRLTRRCWPLVVLTGRSSCGGIVKVDSG